MKWKNSGEFSMCVTGKSYLGRKSQPCCINDPVMDGYFFRVEDRKWHEIWTFPTRKTTATRREKMYDFFTYCKPKTVDESELIFGPVLLIVGRPFVGCESRDVWDGSIFDNNNKFEIFLQFHCFPLAEDGLDVLRVCLEFSIINKEFFNFKMSHEKRKKRDAKSLPFSAQILKL